MEMDFGYKAVMGQELQEEETLSAKLKGFKKQRLVKELKRTNPKPLKADGYKKPLMAMEGE